VPVAPPRQSTVKPRRSRAPQPGRGVAKRVAKWVAVAFVTLAMVDGIFGQRGLIENGRLADRNAEMKATVEALKADNEALADESRRLKEDPAAVEDLARRDLGLLKQGELVVILRDVPAPTPTTPAEFRQDRKKKP
jgi:cell division protein FtsB